MKHLFILGGLMIVISACGQHDLSTAQSLNVKLMGADEAYCVASTQNNRYTINAPGNTLVERDRHDMTIDCKDNMSDRRRVVTIEPHLGLGFWNYPEAVTVDFGQLENGSLKNGYRSANGDLTEKSFSRPLVPKNATAETYSGNTTFETVIMDEIVVGDEIPMDITPQTMTPMAVVEPQKNENNDFGRRSYPLSLD